MKEEISKKEYRQLCNEIWKHNQLYFVQNSPEISDFEFDKLFQLLVAIEKKHPDWVYPGSPTQRVGGIVTGGFPTALHKIPMLSLANTYSQIEVEDFLKRVQKLLHKKEVLFESELKMDGIAISVKYKNGFFNQAITRGNGKKGDDVSSSVKTIGTLPLQLKGDYPEFLEVRGEVFMPIKTFQKLNQEKEEAGEPPLANPRNAAGGALKLLDPKEVAKRGLSIVFYTIAQGDPAQLTSQYGALKFLKKLGLPIVEEFATCKNLEEIWRFAAKVEKKRKTLPYQIDGIVVKVDDLKAQKKLGTTGKNYRWAVAYKFAAEQATTKIEAITVQVGRSGVLTPVAELKPVNLAGSTIARATLHNEDEVKRKDIRVGDTVVIEKGGDVIPKVVEVLTKKRAAKSHVWKMPDKCPACGAPVMRVQKEVAVRCPNKRECPAQALRRIIYFASKAGMDIEHMGEKVVTALVEKGFVQSLDDIYRLSAEELFQLKNTKEKSVENLLSSIEKSKDVALDRFLMALGISFIGAETARALAKAAGSLERLAQLDEDALMEIEGVGKKVAESLVDFFAEPRNLQEIANMLALGVKPKVVKTKQFKQHPFSGKTFVLTGALEHYTRDQARSLIKQRGGKVAGSVSKNTSFVLVGEDPGSKYDKAKKLKISLLDETTFKKML